MHRLFPFPPKRTCWRSANRLAPARTHCCLWLCNETSGCVVFRLPSPEGHSRKTLLVNFFSEAQSSQGLINVNLLYQRHLFCRYRNALTAGSISGNISRRLYTTASSRSASRWWKINLHQTSSSTQLMLDELEAVFHMMGMTTGL